ncbi:hypothetical protein Cantr_00566 [Candida viswanathii]|uniref:Uncharacterized protein n=1 Tax=Candida viswanathii TaxID=5486 RepID=A0A367YGZ0_9ASCO|nr:hypothetical protein Cantr_00566 [Candida viswanathii]
MTPQTFQQVLDSYLRKLRRHPFPAPDVVESDMPSGLTTEKLQVNKSTSIVLHNLILSSKATVEPHPAFEYKTITSKFFVYPEEDQACAVNLGEIVGRVVKFYPFPGVQCDDSIDVRGLLSEHIGLPDLSSTTEVSKELQYDNGPSLQVEVPKILSVKQPNPATNLPKWDMTDSLDVFDIVPEVIPMLCDYSPNTDVGMLKFDNCPTSKYQLDLNTINKQERTINIDCAFPKWPSPTDFQYPNIDSIRQFILDQNRITESGKYFVYPITRFDTSRKDYTSEAVLLVKEFFIKHFYHDELWQLPKHILIDGMTWNPFNFDPEGFVDFHLQESIETEGIIRLLSEVVPWKESKVGFILEQMECEDPVVDITKQPPDTMEPPKQPPPAATTQIFTNVATYQDDTGEIEKLASLHKKRKLDVEPSLILPPEISMLLFVDQNTIQEVESDTNESAKESTPEVEAPRHSFSPTQHIIINQKMWDTDYHLATNLSKAIHVIEAKLDYPVDIIVNATVGICLTTWDHLLQVDTDNSFLVLEDFVRCKLYLRSIAVVAIVTNPWFLEHSGENLQRLQVTCLAFDIRILLVLQEEALPSILELIDLEGPEELDNDTTDRDDRSCTFLCECGLSYFQANRIVMEYGFEKFITSSLQEKLDQLTDLLPSEFLVCMTSSSAAQSHLLTPSHQQYLDSIFESELY